MQIYQVSSDGNIELIDLLKRELTQRFKIHTRDLRPVFLARQLFTISVRGEGIIVNLEDLKILIGVSRSYFLKSTNEKRTNEFLEILSNKLKNKGEDIKVPFEFIVLENALQYTLGKIEDNFTKVETRLIRLLGKLSGSPTEEEFEKLLVLKKQISNLEKEVQEIQNAINEILDDEKEMEEMCISKSKDFDEEDAESILENALEQANEITNKITERKENIDDTQEIITLKMSSIRNTIIRVDLFVSVGATILGLGTLITGFYGMNLKNHFEENHFMFFWITGAIVSLSLFLLFIFYIFVQKKNILERKGK